VAVMRASTLHQNRQFRGGYSDLLLDMFRLKWISLAVPMALLLGCGSSSSGIPSSTGDTPPIESPAADVPSATDSSAAVGATGLTGFGATQSEWDGAHSADPNFESGSSYDQDPSLARDDDLQHDDRYYAASGTTNYSERFALGTPIATARAAALTELPPDAVSVWFAVKDSCAQEVLQSAKLAAAIGSSTGDDTGRVLVEYSSGSAGDHYDAADISEAIYGFASDGDPTPPGETGC
jgi:hypothetical protein